MPSLIEELQRDAMDSSVGISGLLRKAKTIAYKLDLPELAAWVEQELNGYSQHAVPEYRIVIGQVQGRNPFHGWLPVMFETSEQDRLFSRQSIHQKVAELENIVSDAGEGGYLKILLSSEANALLMQATRTHTDFMVRVQTSAAVGILDAVRNALLEWALKLEKAGILGSGMSFSSGERKRAHETKTVINVGTIASFTGTMGSGSGDFSVGGDVVNADSKAAILELITKIRSSEAQLKLDRRSTQELDNALNAIQTEAKKPKPAAERIRELMKTVRNIAEGAAGSLLATGIIYEIDKMFPSN